MFLAPDEGVGQKKSTDHRQQVQIYPISAIAADIGLSLLLQYEGR
jgi:hypothetical protein